MQAHIRSLVNSKLAICIFSIVFLSIILWGQVGLHTSFIVGEQWENIETITQGEDVVPSTTWPTRPLRWVPHLIAYNTAPNSTFGYNLYLVALFIGRGITTYLLFTQLFDKKNLIAYTTTILFLIYPVGGGYFGLAAITIQTALVLGLLSIFFLLWYWRTNNKWLWIAILFTQTISLLTYELFYVLFGVTPILLWWLDKRIHFSHRFIKTCLIWYIFYTIFAIRLIYLIASGNGRYVNNRLDGTLAQKSLIELLPSSIFQMYYDHVVGWGQAFSYLDFRSPEFYMSLGGGLVIGMLGWFIFNKDNVSLQQSLTDKNIKFEIITILGAVCFMILALLVYVPLVHIANGFRIYFLSSLGAAFILAFFLNKLLTYLPYKAFFYSGIVAILIAIGTNYIWHQLQVVVDRSYKTQRILSEIASILPEPGSDIAIIVIDEGSSYKDLSLRGQSYYLDMALEYLYKQPVSAWLCHQEYSTIVEIGDICTFHEDHLEIQIIGQGRDTSVNSFQNFSYQKLVIFYTQNDGSIRLLNNLSDLTDLPDSTLYSPSQYTLSGNPPARVYTYLDCFPFSLCDPLLKNASPEEHIRLDFDVPLRGLGWQEYRPSQQQSWIIGDKALLEFYLINNQSYVLEFSASVLDSQVYEGFSVHIGMIEIPLISKRIEHNKRVFIGFIPSKAIGNKTIINFDMEYATIPAELGVGKSKEELSLLFDWLEIYPLKDSIYQPQSAVRLEFDQDFLGQGWENYNPDKNSRWMMGKSSSIQLFLIPNQPYTLEFSASTIKPEIFDDMKIKVSGVEIPLARIGEGQQGQFSGTIPANLVNEHTLIEIMLTQTFIPAEEGLNNDQRELGLNFDWLQLTAQP